MALGGGRLGGGPRVGGPMRPSQPGTPISPGSRGVDTLRPGGGGRPPIRTGPTAPGVRSPIPRKGGPAGPMMSEGGKVKKKAAKKSRR